MKARKPRRHSNFKTVIGFLISGNLQRTRRAGVTLRRVSVMRESAGKPDALQTLARICRGWRALSRSVWSASGLPALSHGPFARKSRGQNAKLFRPSQRRLAGAGWKRGALGAACICWTGGTHADGGIAACDDDDAGGSAAGAGLRKRGDHGLFGCDAIGSDGPSSGEMKRGDH